jgi:hypothetical protein
MVDAVRTRKADYWAGVNLASKKAVSQHSSDPRRVSNEPCSHPLAETLFMD